MTLGAANFALLMTHALGEGEGGPVPRLTPAQSRKLLDRIAAIRLFAHSYTFIRNMTHGDMCPSDLLDFAFEHELAGICIHLDDGGAESLQDMPAAKRRAFGHQAADLGLAVHLEVSDTTPEEVDRLLAIAGDTGVRNLRVYSRYQGPLSRVLDLIRKDLARVAELAERHDLQVDYEQHEDLKAGEIATLLREIGSPRVNALFDFGNMINAGESPLAALRDLAPFIRQVHMKGVKRLEQDGGWGQLGVPMGGPQDDLPGPRLLYELLMLGEAVPQVVCFALEQEVGYVAPPMRRLDESAEPNIPYREPSETLLDPALTLDRELLNERRWARNQVGQARAMLGRLAACAEAALEDR